MNSQRTVTKIQYFEGSLFVDTHEPKVVDDVKAMLRHYEFVRYETDLVVFVVMRFCLTLRRLTDILIMQTRHSRTTLGAHAVWGSIVV